MTQREILFHLIRCAVLDSPQPLPEGAVADWDSLMDVATCEGVLAWVYDGICMLPKEQQPSRQQRINWALSAQEIWDRYEKQKEVLYKMVDVCTENKMRLLLLKGIGISELYPKPQSRPSGDLDVFFFDDYELANTIFAKGQYKESPLHSTFYFKGVEVENHKQLVYPNTKIKALVSEYLNKHISESHCEKEGWYGLSPMPNLIYLLMHSINHINYSSDTILPIRNIIDFGLFIDKNKDNIPYGTLIDTLDRLGLTKAFSLLLCLIENILGIPFTEYKTATNKKIESLARRFFDIENLSIKNHSKIAKTILIIRRYCQLVPIALILPSKPQNSLTHTTLSSMIDIWFRQSN